MVDAAVARRMVDALERGDAREAAELYSERIRGYISAGWSLEDYLRDRWAAGLDDLAGSPREIVDETITPWAVRFTIEGPRGRGYATISFEEDGSGVGGTGLEREVFEGIGNLVINCPWPRVSELAAYYGALFGEDRWRIPRLVFDEGLDDPPGWRDPQRPQQLHLEAEVGDLDAASEVAMRNGGTLLEELDDRRTFGDPLGHATTYIRGQSDGAVARLVRVVIDCPDPSELAPFYEQLLRMPVRLGNSADRAVIASDDGRPQLAFERVTPFNAPTWPDPRFPAQMHFDLKVYDAEAAISTAERLGAKRLPKGGSCPVFADPAGHPFCLCMHGQ